MVNEINGLNGIKAWYIALRVPKEMYKSDLRDMLKIEDIRLNVNLGLSGKTLVDHISTVVEDYTDNLEKGISIEEYDTVMKGYLALNMLYPADFRVKNRDGSGNKVIPEEFIPYVKEKVKLLEKFHRGYERIKTLVK
ncbi:hypothetical protein HN385_00405 [archaeon]|jgi:hypothetical protein|nr:hypothetical protein [archaeon]MBT3451615.1 hypothetical protein [archaeon]MBT6869636.1 hypothetical protein [archaeon]MBT7192404.1 hypothetical protein [archaeon]MBT7380205.1 hypothetical protein [archaeon]